MDALTLDLDHPHIRAWALDRIIDLKQGDPIRYQAALEAWFPPERLRRWIAELEPRQLKLLLLKIPAEGLLGVGDALAEVWPRLPPQLGRVRADTLAQAAPQLAAAAFLNVLNEGGHAQVVRGILNAAPRLIGEGGARVTDLLVDRILAGEPPPMDPGLALAGTLRAACLHLPERVPELLDLLAAEIPDSDGHDELWEPIHALAEHFTGQPWTLDLHAMVLRGEIAPSLAPYSLLLTEDAPLTEIQDVWESYRPLSDGLTLLERYASRMPGAPWARLLAEAILARAPEPPPGLDEDQLDDFPHDLRWAPASGLCLALVLRSFSRESLDLDEMDLDRVLDHLSLDIPTLPHLTPLTNRLRAFEPSDVMAAVSARFNALDQSWGQTHVVEALGALALPESLPLLTRLLTEESAGPWESTVEAAAEALHRLGPLARDAIIADWERWRQGGLISASELLCAIGGDQVTELALRSADELVEDQPGVAADLLQLEPDPRALARLQGMLYRHDTALDTAYVRLASILGEEPEGLAEVEARVAQSQSWLDEALEIDVTDPDSSAPTTALRRLELVCSTCQSKAWYQIHRLYVTVSPAIQWEVAEELECRRCGDLADFTATQRGEQLAMARFSVAIQLADAAQEDLGVTFVSGIQSVTGGFEGISDALARRRAEVARRPADGAANLRMAQLLYRILDRPRAAREYAEIAARQLPLYPEAFAVYAELLRELDGHQDAVFDKLVKVASRHPQWMYFRGNVRSNRDIARDFIDAYQDYQLQLGRLEAPLLGEDLLQTIPASAPKLGRNDPCHCGSGKKYKRCCLRG